VSTPTATVGIRGTGGVIQVQDDGSTLVQGTSGIWFLANPAGTIDIPAGISGVAPTDPNQPPQETTDVPTSGPAPLPPQQDFAQGEERDSTGENIITPPSPTGILTSGGGYTVALAFGATPFSQTPSPDVSLVVDGDAIFNAQGQLQQISGFNEFSDPVTYKLTSGSNVDFGTDGIVAWGRWVGTAEVVANFCEGACGTSTETYGQNQGLHYVVGLPTSSMPQSGTASYTLLGATQPTYLDGSQSPGSFSGGLTVNFGSLTVSTALNVVMPDASYAIRGDAPISGNVFANTGCTFCDSTLTISGGSCGGACGYCEVKVNGFFAGSTAERAGLGYHIGDYSNGSKDIVGAAAFQKQ